MAGPRNILVIGATGKQGRSLINCLLERVVPSSSGAEAIEYRVLALTRDPSSAAARYLLDHHKHRADDIALKQGNLDEPQSVRAVFEETVSQGGVWGVFVALAYPGLGASAEREAQQGTMLADLSLEFNVQVFIYSSSLRVGPAEEGNHDDSRRAKQLIENHCKALGKQGLNFVILRPGFFMENFDDFLGEIAVSVLRVGISADTEICLVASEDIGRVAMGVFMSHESFLHKNLAITSEEATMKEIAAAHLRATGRSIPASPSFIGWLLLKMNSACKKLVNDIERTHLAKADDPIFGAEVQLALSVCRLQKYEEWVSKKKGPDVPKQNWNNISIVKLLTGRS